MSVDAGRKLIGPCRVTECGGRARWPGPSFPETDRPYLPGDAGTRRRSYLPSPSDWRAGRRYWKSTQTGTQQPPDADQSARGDRSGAGRPPGSANLGRAEVLAATCLALSGRTPSEFVVAGAAEAANHVIQEHATIRLSRAVSSLGLGARCDERPASRRPPALLVSRAQTGQLLPLECWRSLA